MHFDCAVLLFLPSTNEANEILEEAKPLKPPRSHGGTLQKSGTAVIHVAYVIELIFVIVKLTIDHYIP